MWIITENIQYIKNAVDFLDVCTYEINLAAFLHVFTYVNAICLKVKKHLIFSQPYTADYRRGDRERVWEPVNIFFGSPSKEGPAKSLYAKSKKTDSHLQSDFGLV
jgi:hypothetical protein